VVLATTLYSATILDLKTVAYFHALYEIEFDPKSNANPPSRKPAKSALEKALTKVEEELLRRIPREDVSPIYLKVRFTAVQWSNEL
jgi:hypothetical protein